MNLETGLVLITATALTGWAVLFLRNQRAAQKKAVKRFVSTYVAPPLPGSVDDWSPQQRKVVRQTLVCGGQSKYEPLYKTPLMRLMEWEASQRAAERVERGLTEEEQWQEIMLPDDLNEWTPEHRAYVKQSIEKYGLPKFRASLQDLELSSPQRLFLEWEGKGIFEQLDEHRKGVKPLVNNEEKDEKP